MKSIKRNNWVSDHPDKLPDFIIAGAMKSGTTTLHSILDRHPSVKMAHGELGFFDMDSILSHPDFHFYDNRTQKWTVQSMEESPEKLWNWYYSHFEYIKKDGVLIGEDSTTYLSSPLAAQRIALQQKPIKLIFLLRNPTKRTISNYLHALKSGRAIYNLEDTLRYIPNSILRRSMYKEQLESYYKHIPDERIKVIVFEDFISNTKYSIAEICEFLEIDFNDFQESDLLLHSNKTKIPKYENLQLLRNRLLRYYGDHRYMNMPVMPKDFQADIPWSHKLINKINKKINPMKADVKYIPKPETVAYLDAFFRTEMQGLDDLVKKDITSRWFI